MAHEIDSSNGRDNMAYVGNVPWHGLGQALTPESDLSTWKREAGMDWKIETSPVIYRANGCDEDLLMPERKLLYRGDNNASLAVVSSGFKIVQPGEVMDFFNSLIDDFGFAMETAGCLFGGRKFWALARTGKDVKILGEDTISPYLLLASACDGSMATCAHLTSVRVVCNNTLRMAIGQEGKRAKIKVNHSSEFDHGAVKAQLGIVNAAWDNFIGNVQLLAKRKIHRDDAIDIVAKQLKEEWRNKDGGEMNREEQLEASLALRNIIRLFDGDAKGAGFKSSKGTMWGLLNAVTEYIDHESGAKNGDRSRTFERAHLTDRANFKVQVADELLKLAA